MENTCVNFAFSTKNVKVLFYPMPPDFWKSISFFGTFSGFVSLFGW